MFHRHWALSTSCLAWNIFEPFIYYCWVPRLWLQGDNTVKELRNSFTGKLASLLTSFEFFNCVSHHHLVVGHTHEDVGFSALMESWAYPEPVLECPCSWVARSLILPCPPGRWSYGTGDISSVCWIKSPNPTRCHPDTKLCCYFCRNFAMI